MSRFIFIVLLLFCTTALPAERTVLIVGDSLSSGYGLPREQAWPALLEKRLGAHSPPYRLVNASISGDTSANGRSRLGAAMKQHRPAVVILALGANDGLRGLSIPALRDNLSAMAAAIRAAGAGLVVVGMEMPPNYGSAYQRQFREVFPAVASKHRSPLVPFMLEGFAEKRDYFQSDGIHPAAIAQPLILENLWSALQPLLR